MPDIDDLIRNLRQFRATVVRDIPRQLGQEMLEQTHESFKEERFAGSPGGKWPDRTAFGGESNIRYPKLDYNGFLKKSFKWISRRIGRNDADIFVGTDVPFARAHNEGGGLLIILLTDRQSGAMCIGAGGNTTVRSKKGSFWV